MQQISNFSKIHACRQSLKYTNAIYIANKITLNDYNMGKKVRGH